MILMCVKERRRYAASRCAPVVRNRKKSLSGLLALEVLRFWYCLQPFACTRKQAITHLRNKEKKKNRPMMTTRESCGQGKGGFPTHLDNQSMRPGLKVPVIVNRLILIFGYMVSNISMCFERVLMVPPSTSLEQCTTISLLVCSLSLQAHGINKYRGTGPAASTP